MSEYVSWGIEHHSNVLCSDDKPVTLTVVGKVVKSRFFSVQGTPIRAPRVAIVPIRSVDVRAIQNIRQYHSNARVSPELKAAHVIFTGRRPRMCKAEQSVEVSALFSGRTYMALINVTTDSV